MPKGFRVPAQDSRKQRITVLEAELKQLATAARLSQMMLQRMMENTQNISYDIGKAFNMISELQYKLLAAEKIANLDPKAIAAAANEIRLTDFNEASAKEDIQKNYTIPEVVSEDSVVIITTTAEQPDKSIFRSKVALKEANVPELTKGLVGREVGAKLVVSLAGVKHTVELLGIRQPPAAKPTAIDAAAGQANEGTEAQGSPVGSPTSANAASDNVATVQ